MDKLNPYAAIDKLYQEAQECISALETELANRIHVELDACERARKAEARISALEAALKNVVATFVPIVDREGLEAFQNAMRAAREALKP